MEHKAPYPTENQPMNAYPNAPAAGFVHQPSEFHHQPPPSYDNMNQNAHFQQQQQFQQPQFQQQQFQQPTMVQGKLRESVENWDIEENSIL